MIEKQLAFMVFYRCKFLEGEENYATYYCEIMAGKK